MADRLLREVDSGSASSSMTSESDHPHTNSEEFGILHLTTVQMEVDVETVTEMQGDASLES